MFILCVVIAYRLCIMDPFSNFSIIFLNVLIIYDFITVVKKNINVCYNEQFLAVCVLCLGMRHGEWVGC